jgi:Bacteriocin-protection, YdeI or OmpD-Associated/Domain of unknown function (DUF1905)
MIKFKTTLLQHGKTATGIEVPPEVVESLGGGKKPPVRVTIAGHTYRSTIAPRKDRYLLGVSAENRKLAGVEAGDDIQVELDLDTEPRVIELPVDLAEALAAEAKAKEFYEDLTPSQQGSYVAWVESAKKAETRETRVAKSVEKLSAGQKNP